MPQETVPLPGSRRAEATVSYPHATELGSLDTCVVACPPHPEFGGHRGDPRLRAVTDELLDNGVASLRFDYGGWDEGFGEREDARNAIRWADERAEQVGVFGYSFGGAIATLATATVEVDVSALSLLAPLSRISDDLDATAALQDIACPVQVAYGERDDTVDWVGIVETARKRGDTIDVLPSDHHFVGQHDRICEVVVPFFLSSFM